MNDLTLEFSPLSQEQSQESYKIISCSNINLIQTTLLPRQYTKESSTDVYYAIIIGIPCDAFYLASIDSILLQSKNIPKEELLILKEEITFIKNSLTDSNSSLSSISPSIFSSTKSQKDLCTNYIQQKIFMLSSFRTISDRNHFIKLFQNRLLLSNPEEIHHNRPPLLCLPINPLIVSNNISPLLLSSLNVIIPVKQTSSSPSSSKLSIQRTSRFLPTCPVCIRRIKFEQNLLSSILFDDQHTSDTANNNNNEGKPFYDVLINCNFYDYEITLNDDHFSSLKMSNEEEEYSPIVPISCMVCYTYKISSLQSTYKHAPPIDDQFSRLISPITSQETSHMKAASHYPSVFQCSACSMEKNIWICLNCGYTGCGRYTAKHAETHSLNTSHTLALELVSGRVWDYIADQFVQNEITTSTTLNAMSESSPIHILYTFPEILHERIIHQDLEKIILVAKDHLENKLQSSLQSSSVEKLNSISKEYEDLLACQLQEQQLYFEKQLARETVRLLEYSLTTTNTNTNINQPTSSSSSSSAILSNHYNDIQTTQLENLLENIESIKLDISSWENKIQSDLMLSYQELSQKNQKVIQSNDKLSREIQALKSQEISLKDKLEGLDKKHQNEIQDLESQITDFKFFLKSQKQMSQTELAEGTIITHVNEPPPPSNNNNKKQQKNTSRFKRK